MKRSLAVLLCTALLLGLTSVATAAAEDVRLEVTASALNVRGGPGTNYAILDVLHAGDRVTAAGQHAGWYKVQLDGGLSGWVSGAYVQASGNATTLPELPAPALPAAAAPSPARPARQIIVFQTSSGGAMYSMNANGAGLRYLTSGIDPALSPDGRTVAFTRWTMGNSGSVWLINADGTNERVLLNDVVQPKSPAWSPDGTRIVVNMQQGGTVNDVRQTISLGCGRPAIPPDATDIEVVPPDCSGGKLVRAGTLTFTVKANPYWGLRMIEVASGVYQDLPRDRHSFAPTWDPAQPWRIVYHGDHGLMNVDVNQQTSWLLSANVDQRAPVFSPDGTLIATTYRQSDHWEVHVMNADGTGDRRLTEMPLTAIVDAQLRGEQARVWNNAAPAWSPDGTQIAFLSDRNGPWEVWVMNADGSNQRLLLPASALGSTGIAYNGVDERVITWR